MSVLDGIRVLDLSIARAGPTAVRLLADYGADVIRVETPDDSGSIARDHDSGDYINLHCSKRLLTLNLKKPEGQVIFRRLLSECDVLVENFRPPVKTKLGIDYDTLQPLHPRLVYASISGYGQDGPFAERGAVDQIIQGFAGLMSVTGTPGGPPTRAGIAVADLAAGTLLANGILLALLERERSGAGQWVQVSLVEAMISFLDFQAARWIVDGEVAPMAGNHHPTLTPMGLYSAADGYINIAAPSDRLFERFCCALDAPELVQRREYASAAQRHAHREELNAAIDVLLRRWTRAEIEERLHGAGVPCGPVHDMREVFEHPQVQHLAVTEPVDHPDRGAVSVLRTPIVLSRSARAPKRPSPTPSQHTTEILASLGYDAAAVEQLRTDGVV